MHDLIGQNLAKGIQTDQPFRYRKFETADLIRFSFFELIQSNDVSLEFIQSNDVSPETLVPRAPGPAG